MSGRNTIGHGHHQRSHSRGSDMSYGDEGDFRSSNRSLNTMPQGDGDHGGREFNGGGRYSNRRAGGGGVSGGFQRKRNDSEYSNDYTGSYARSTGKSSNYSGGGNKFGGNRGTGDDHYSSQEHVDRQQQGGGGGGNLKVSEDWANSDADGRFKKIQKR